MLQNQKNNLPKLGQSYAFCRLPTEAEWTFAARGGISILEKDPDRFDRPHPYGEDLGKYEWHRGNTGSKIKECGIKSQQPNPIGLRDMLGNVEEFTLSLFSPEYKQGRFGQLVIRGNNYSDSADDFDVSHRTEFASHDQQGELRHPPKVGFRLALSSAVSSSATSERLNEDCKKYMSSDARYKGSSTAALAERNSREYSQKKADRFKTDIEGKNSEISRLQRLRKQDQAALSEKEKNILKLSERKEELEAQVHDLQKQLIARPAPDAAEALQQKLRQAEVEIQGLTEDLHETQKKLKKLIPIEHDPGSGPLFLTASEKTESGKLRQQIQELKQQIAALPSLKEWEKSEQEFDQLQKQNENLTLKLSKKQVKERFFI
ncbi:MAG: hypothetical protein D3906_17185, partial [Candidatus Electrothrix sp. AUS1_2]|nr:hypothetical protein [Candidatus Electrothrix sp. AUS1_2]